MKPASLAAVWLALALPALAGGEREVVDLRTGAVFVLSWPDDGTIRMASKTDPADVFLMTKDCTSDHPVHGPGYVVEDTQRGWAILLEDGRMRFSGMMPMSKKPCLPEPLVRKHRNRLHDSGD